MLVLIIMAASLLKKHETATLTAPRPQMRERVYQEVDAQVLDYPSGITHCLKNILSCADSAMYRADEGALESLRMIAAMAVECLVSARRGEHTSSAILEMR